MSSNHHHPYSFLQVIRPETDILLTNQERFKRIRSRLNQFIDKTHLGKTKHLVTFCMNKNLRAGPIQNYRIIRVNKAEVHLHRKP